MKRKSTQQDIVAAASSNFSKNLRSKLPCRRRALISPINVNFTTSKPAFSPDSTCDEVSCNTTLESAVLPWNASFQSVNESFRPLKKAAVEVSVSQNSCVDSCSIIVTEAESKLQKNRQRQNGVVLSEFSAAQNSPSTVTVEQSAAKNSGEFEILCADLACSEGFSYENCEVQSEIFSGGDGCSEFENFTDDYTPSMWFTSGSQFSERSDDDSDPSPCFCLFEELFKQFSKLRSVNFKCEASSVFDDEYSDELQSWRFEDEEDEESYCCLRRRERNQAAKVIDYAEDYDFATEYGGLIVEQRLLMVNWIIEISRKKELHNETMFLGVCLLDRFLSKGFFTSRRNSQLLGIACLTLAIRLEENRPYNSVREKGFYVGSDIYCRTEVLAMEWVVQEVLKFQCLSPTIYNFLEFYLKAAKANERMREKANNLATLALLDHRKLQFWPSTVAATVVILVSVSENREDSCQRVMKAHFGGKVDDLPECINSLEWLVKYAR